MINTLTAEQAKKITYEAIERRKVLDEIFYTINRFAKNGYYNIEVSCIHDTDIQSFLISLGYDVITSNKSTTIYWND